MIFILRLVKVYKRDLTIGKDSVGNEFFYVGWLDPQHKFHKGETNDTFKYFLWKHFDYKINIKRGVFCCKFNHGFFKKNSSKVSLYIDYDGERRKVGFYDLLVFNDEGVAYLAPSLIFHYVTYHNYSPPSDFINAVCDGVMPGTNDYHRLIGRYIW